MSSYSQYKQNALNNPEVKAEYDALQAEYNIIQAMIKHIKKLIPITIIAIILIIGLLSCFLKKEPGQTVVTEEVLLENDSLHMDNWQSIEILTNYSFSTNSATGWWIRLLKENGAWFCTYTPGVESIEDYYDHDCYVDDDLVLSMKDIIKAEGWQIKEYSDGDAADSVIRVSGDFDDETGLDTLYIEVTNVEKLDSIRQQIMEAADF